MDATKAIGEGGGRGWGGWVASPTQWTWICANGGRQWRTGSLVYCGPWCVPSHFNPVWLFAALWTAAFQAPLSLGFSRKENSSGVSMSARGSSQPGNHALVSYVSGIGSRFFTTRITWEGLCCSPWGCKESDMTYWTTAALSDRLKRKMVERLVCQFNCRYIFFVCGNVLTVKHPNVSILLDHFS